MRFKYPKTYHLPWSLGITSDDKILGDLSVLRKRPIVATLKLDGENTTMYSDYIHARSIDSKDHPSRHWVKSFHSKMKHLIPDGWRICGENLYAKHSIPYEDLDSYFMGFSIWDENNICLDWDVTVSFFYLMDIIPVPAIHNIRPKRSLEEIHELFMNNYSTTHEGYVVRVAGEFKFEDFQTHTAKYVRPNHVQTDKHWMYDEIITNKLKGDKHDRF